MSVLRQPQLVHSEYRFRTTMLFASLLCVLAVAIILGLVAFDSSGMMSTMVALSAVGLLVAGIVEFQVGFTIRERNGRKTNQVFPETDSCHGSPALPRF